MSRRYAPEIVREACALFVGGRTPEQVAEEMQRRGHAGFNADTIRRWARQYNLVEAHTINEVDNVKAAIILDSQRVINELLEAALNTRKAITNKLSSGGIHSSKLLGHLKKVDGLISSLVSITK